MATTFGPRTLYVIVFSLFRAHVILTLGRGENCLRIVCKEMEDLCSYTQVNLPGNSSHSLMMLLGKFACYLRNVWVYGLPIFTMY